MKKTLVYQHGRAPRGQRTNWVMHEYKLTDETLARAGIFQDAFVLCRIFQKSGPGPKNGEQYGAPLVEEEWENDEFVISPGKEVVQEPGVSDDSDVYLDSNDIQQIFGELIPVEDVPLPLSFSHGDNSAQAQETPDEGNYHVQNPNNQQLSAMEMQYQFGFEPESEEVVDESNNSDLDFLLDDSFFDAISVGPFDDLVKGDPAGLGMFDEYFNFYNADQYNNPQYVGFDPSNMAGSGKYSFIEKASHMLGGVSAPPALASEFPTKESALRLSRSSVQLTAGMIHVQKPKDVTETSFVFSLGLSTSLLSRSIIYMMLFWVMVLLVAYKARIFFCSGSISS